MSHGQAQRHDEFVPIGSVEHERRLALKHLLLEINDVMAYLEEFPAPIEAGFSTKGLETAYQRVRTTFGLSPHHVPPAPRSTDGR